MKTAGIIVLGGGVIAYLVIVLIGGNVFGENTNEDHTTHMMGQEFINEREFLEQMIPHHKEAIATAIEVLERGATTPGMQALAEAIIETQTREVVLMKENYEKWYGMPYEDHGQYQSMMRELTNLSDEELDLVFLHDMTMHHMGAIMMAKSVLSIAEHEAVSTLANSIVLTQTAEIETMRELFREINQVAERIEIGAMAIIHKSPTCGCCAGYAEYMEGFGYNISIQNTNELIAIKEQFGIPASLESCHTMEIGGYVVEGHVPEEAVQKLLAEQPDIKGIGMAGMPSGSPGMPGPKEDFAIYEINLDGTKGNLFMIL